MKLKLGSGTPVHVPVFARRYLFLLLLALALVACGGTAAEPTPTIRPAAGNTPSPTVGLTPGATPTGARLTPVATPTLATSPTPTTAPPASPTPTAGPVSKTLTIYSGRSENLVKPIIDQFAKASGLEVKVRYGSTAQMASTILEEGKNSPADVFFAQDAGALGALASAGLLDPLPDPILERVEPRFRSPNKEWVGLSGRARVVTYNTDKVSPQNLPDSILGFTDPKWKGRIGWPPRNGSFQAFVTAFRLVHGDAAAKQWLEGIKANNPKEYPDNTPALQAVVSGEVEVAFINHYYLHRLLKEQGPGVKARNHYFGRGDVGDLVNVAGAAVLKSSSNKEVARRFIDFMLSDLAQRYFAQETFEYPLVAGVPAPEGVPPLAQLQSPNIDLSKLEDLQGTLKLLREVGLIP